MSEPEKSSVLKTVSMMSLGLIMSSAITGVCLQEVYHHSKDLKPLHRGFEVPVILAIVDLVSLFVLLKFEFSQGLRSIAEAIGVTLISHFIMEYILNFWFSFSRTHSFPVGYFEPVMMVVLLKICTGYDVSVQIFACLVFISVIAGFTSGSVTHIFSASRNGMIIFLVIFFLSLRNIGLKLLQENTVKMHLRTKVVAPYTLSILSLGFILSALHLTFWALPVMFSMTAMFSSVAMFYFSFRLLEHCHVTAISVFGVLSQMAINVTCMPGLHTHNVLVSFLASLVLLSLTVVYFRLSSDPEPSFAVSNFPMPHAEIYTRMEFLLFVGGVCGLIFYVFQPKLSERDLNNLHYVGLDSIVKKLLNQA